MTIQYPYINNPKQLVECKPNLINEKLDCNIFHLIFQSIPLGQMTNNVSLVCKSWNVHSNDNLLWKIFCKKIGVECNSNREGEYKELFMLHNLMRTGQFKVTPYPLKIKLTTQFGEVDAFETMIFLHDTLIASISSCCEILTVWDIGTKKEICSFKDDFHGLQCFKYIGNGQIATVNSSLKKMNIWNIHSNETITYSPPTVTNVYGMYSNKVYKIKSPKFLIYALESYDKDTILIASSEAVYSLNINTLDIKKIKDDNRTEQIISFGNENFLTIHDVFATIFNTATKERSIKQMHTKHITCITRLRNDLVATGSEDTNIKILNVKTENLLSLEEHNGKILAITPIGLNHMASASTDGTIKIWNVNTSTCKQTIHMDDDICRVNQLIFTGNGCLLGISACKKLVMWKLKKEIKETQKPCNDRSWCNLF